MKERAHHSFEDLKRQVVDSGLCLHCGSCQGLCPVEAIAMSAVENGCLPRLAGECVSCGLCLSICPGRGVSYGVINRHLFGRVSASPLGVFSALYIGHANDGGIRRNGSSGGLVTSILLDLLHSRRIDGAAVVTGDPRRPWLSRSVVAASDASIVEAAQSKYIVHPHNTVLRRLEKAGGRYAYVGLPCQIEAIRKLQIASPERLRNLKLVIGIYCGGTLQFGALRSLLDRFGIQRLEDVEAVKWRAGTWPGRFEVRTRNGRRSGMSKDALNYLSFTHTTPRCLYCPNLSSEFADISVGDAWADHLLESGQGWSLVVVRTERGRAAMRSLSPETASLRAVSENDALRMHAHGLNNKKIGTFIRIRHLRRRGKKAPRFDVRADSPPASRVVTEYVLLLLLWCCRLAAVQRLLNAVPSATLERLMKKAKRGLKRRSNTHLGL